MGSSHDALRLAADPGFLMDGIDVPQAFHPGGLLIQNQQVIRLSIPRVPHPQAFRRLAFGQHAVRVHVEGIQISRQERQPLRVRIQHQGADFLQPHGVCPNPLFILKVGIRHERQADAEGGTFVGDAVHLNGSTHHFRQAFHDGKAKTGPAKPAGNGIIRLLEGDEQCFQLRFRHADARVGH